MRFEVGSVVRVVTTKWRDQPHWEYEGHYLGCDEHGDWIGFPVGTGFARPGVDLTMPNDQVGLVPADDADQRWWLAGFHGPGSDFRLYVDMTTPPRWDGSVLRAVDLDLDVIQGLHGRVWVDDEDEFADHRVRFGYPAEVVDGALASCAAIGRAVREGVAPFDGATAERWLAAVADLRQ
ncbi:MAG: DUF402 domain-containing protein [Nocardioides sp.]